MTNQGKPAGHYEATDPNAVVQVMTWHLVIAMLQHTADLPDKISIQCAGIEHMMGDEIDPTRS